MGGRSGDKRDRDKDRRGGRRQKDNDRSGEKQNGRRETTQRFCESIPPLRSTPPPKQEQTIFTDKYLGPPHCPPFVGILSSLAPFSCVCMAEIQVGTEIQARWEAVAFAQRKSKLVSQKRRINHSSVPRNLPSNLLAHTSKRTGKHQGLQRVCKVTVCVGNKRMHLCS